MAVKPFKVECERCLRPLSLRDRVCPDCGGRTIKYCGSCKWKLSAAKKYCDSCGDPQEMVDPGPPAPPGATPVPPRLGRRQPEPEPRAEPPAGKQPPPPAERPKDLPEPPGGLPRTIIRRAEPEPTPEKRAEKPPERAPEKDRRPPPREERRDDRRERRAGDARPPEPGTGPATLVRRRSKASTVLSIVLLLGGAGLYGYYLLVRRTPERLLRRAAERYLTALQQRRFPDAHAQLCEASRRALPPEQFARLQGTGDWTWSKLEVRTLETDRALVVYELAEQGTSERDWLHFIREQGEWRRVYWWHLQDPIEEDLAKGDFAMARARAAEAAALAPLDPLVHGYLCEAAYGAEDFAGARGHCAKALELAKDFPSRLGDRGLFHLRLLLADAYRHGLGELEAARKEYGLLLAFPKLEPGERCELTLASADAAYLAGEHAAAAASFREAAGACPNPEDAAYGAHAAAVLSGEAGEEAVALAQRHKLPGEKDSLFEWRRKSREELARRLKLSAGDLPQAEAWKPAHVAGSNYRVSVANADSEVLTAEVDLWTRKVKVDIHVQ